MAIETTAARGGGVGLDAHGIEPQAAVWWNLPVAALYERALASGEAELAEGGALVVSTGAHTGRAPKDKYLVREPGSEDRVWWGAVNQPIDAAVHASLGERLRAHLGAGDIYVIDAWAGADPAHRLPLRVVTESAWHALFARTLFIEPTDEELEAHRPGALVLHAPSFTADTGADGTRAGNFVILHLTDQEILIGGTQYAGEIKKSIFTLMNYRLPQRGVLSMHCSANVGADGRVAVFFGLSGTGKTTLSTDSQRPLIGDDEHGWSEDGVFNIEGGCYAKVIKPLARGRARDLRHHPHLRHRARERGDGPGHAAAGPRRRRASPRTPAAPIRSRSIPNARHGEARRAPLDDRDADRRRLRRPAAGGRAEPRGGDVPFPLRLHRQGGRHRGGRHRAPGGLQRLLRRALPAAAALGLRRAAARADPGARRERLAGQHRLDRRRLRHRLAHADRRHARHRPRPPSPATSTVAPTRTDPVFGFQVPTEVPGVNAALLDPRGTWDDPEAYDAAAADLAAKIQEHAAEMRR